MKKVLILLAAIAMILTTGVAMAQSTNEMPSIGSRGSMFDAVALFAVAILAVAGGLLIRRRVQ